MFLSYHIISYHGWAARALENVVRPVIVFVNLLLPGRVVYVCTAVLLYHGSSLNTVMRLEEKGGSCVPDGDSVKGRVSERGLERDDRTAVQTAKSSVCMCDGFMGACSSYMYKAGTVYERILEYII